LKLYSNPHSPFSRKVRVVAHACGIPLDVADVLPLKDEGLRLVNPLGRIPALVLDDGTVLLDSKVIAEFLDRDGAFHPAGAARWRALNLQALGDGIAEAAVAHSILGRDEPPPAASRDRHWGAVMRGLDALEQSDLSDTPAIGEIAAACALNYVGFRNPDLDWKGSRPTLAGWYARFCEHPSWKATA
jgi:glutathione S-transferase